MKKFEFKNIVNEYADLKGLTCSADGNNISIVVDIDVPQLKDDFNVYINFNSDDFECDYDYDW